MNFYQSIFLSSLLIATPVVHANESNEKPKVEKDQKIDKEQKKEVKEEVVITSHSVNINGIETSYKASVGTQTLKDDQGNSKASIFYIAYTKENVENKISRPVTFCFNGGPGSSSVWLHLGIFGPKRVNINDNGLSVNLPYHLVDNPSSILDITDLVFIDPVSTGYSRAVSGEDAKQFHGVDEDIQSVAEFIRLYTTRNELWEVPKFIAGESYGTTRAAGLAQELHDKQHLYLDGILLISTVLNFQTISFTSGNDLPYVLFLPSYTATAFYHQKLPADLQKDLKKTLWEVEEFAKNEYALALMKGDSLTSEDRSVIIDKLARYTGLTKTYIDQTDLRINILRFAQEFLRSERRTIGRFDSRMKGISSDACSDVFEFDPSFDLIMGLFAATFNNYIRADLNWKSDDEYKILATVWPWNYGIASNKYLNVSDKLRDVMSKNPSLEVYVASGLNDLATPYFATDYTISHLGLDPLLRNHITLKNYEGGHMMYLKSITLLKMKEDISSYFKHRVEKREQQFTMDGKKS